MTSTLATFVLSAIGGVLVSIIVRRWIDTHQDRREQRLRRLNRLKKAASAFIDTRASARMRIRGEGYREPAELEADHPSEKAAIELLEAAQQAIRAER